MKLGFILTLSLSLTAILAEAQTAITTYHYNPQRTGWNSTETTLTPSSVASEFGHLVTVTLDDQVDTQPLVVPNQTIEGAGAHTVVYVTTENNTVYAIDGNTGAILKSRNLGAPVSAPLGCNNNGPNVGINGTGTIDLATSTFYVLVYNQTGSGPAYNLHALDLSTLADHAGSPVVVSGQQTYASGGTYNFNASVQRQRPGMLEANNRLYAGFGSFCDYAANQSRGWVLSWDKSSLAPENPDESTDRLATSGSVNFLLSSVWMSGYGLATDSSGSVYFTTGNTGSGTYNGTTNIGESAVKMSADLSSVQGLFTPSNEASLDSGDTDYGSGGLMILPDQSGAFPHIAVAAGKDGRLFVLNRDSLGGFHSPDVPNNVNVGGCWCGPAYFEGPGGPRVITSGGSQVQSWTLTTSGGKPGVAHEASAPAIESSSQDPGFFTSVSSNGTAANSAVIWAVGRASGTDLHLTLYAYNATASGETLPLLWSGVAGSWPNSNGNANIVPTVANGHVYVASNKELQIFGIRPPNDVTIWQYTGVPCSGTACPGWQELDNNTKTVEVISDGNVYQLHNDGMIWKATGAACVANICPGWERLDDNIAAVNIAAAGGELYELHNTGKIWKYTGTPCNGNSCPGWQMLDDNVAAVRIAAGGTNLYQLHNDGTIWKYTGTPCSGTSCPGWQMLDNNIAAVEIRADGNDLYERHNGGKIWKYTGTPCSGNSCPGWQMLDDNTAAVAIAASGGNLYELHNTGKIWKYTGTPCSGTSCPGWQMLDDNIAAVAIKADGGSLYQRHNSGKVWKYTGTPCSGTSCPGWQMLDDNIATTQIGAGGGKLLQLHDGLLYQLHSDGSIWRYDGAPCATNGCPGWQMLDNNPRAVAIASGGRQLYELHKDGSIWRYTGTPCSGSSCPGWQMLDNNPQGAAIAAADQLYELHKDGSIWRFLGTPCTGNSCPNWQEIDNNSKTTAIATAGREVFELHSDGSIWRYTNAACSATSCPGWQMLDNNPQGAAIAAGYDLIELHKDGSIWRFLGTPCSGTSCPSWQQLDNNPAAKAIATAGREVFELHTDGSIWRYTNTPCSGSSCPGWQRLDDNPLGAAIAAGDQLYQFHSDGSIWRFLGTPCNGNSCPSWQELDNNPAGKAISASAVITQ